MLGDVLDLAETGYYVFPLHTPVLGGCSCAKPDCTNIGKHPRTQNGLHAATRDPKQIEEWWGMWPTANVAIRTGSLSGVWVLDIDPRHGGNESLAALVHEHTPLPESLCVWTGSGGRHIYFRWPVDGPPIRNMQGLAPGIDVRGEGGYVVAPPSLHASGDRYEWLRGE